MENIKSEAEAMKPCAIRMKASTFDRLKALAAEEGLNIGDELEMIVDDYEKNHSPEGYRLFTVRINRIDKSDYLSMQKLSYTGRVLFRTAKVQYNPASFFENQLRKAYKLSSLDLSECEVGSALTLIAEDNGGYALQETLYLKKNGENDSIICDSWVDILEPDSNPANRISPFASMNDIISISAMMSEEYTAFDIFGDADDELDDGDERPPFRLGMPDFS